MSRIIKTGVALRKDTLDKLKIYMDKTGLNNRSKIIDEALELYLAERSLLIDFGKVGGAILVYYHHHAEGELTHLQHDFIDIIISNTHMHIDRDNCIEAILVRGEINRIRDLVNMLEKIKDVKAVKYGFFKI